VAVRRVRTFGCCLALGIALGAAAAPAPAPEPPPAEPTATPAGQPAAPPHIVFDKTELDLGEVLRGKDAVATFTYRNTGSVPLHILSAKPG
jgi:Protein of unknown function (DUF1573)